MGEDHPDVLQARIVARQSWDSETLRGPAEQALGSNHDVLLPRGLAHQGRYARRLLELFGGDVQRLLATAALCREHAQDQERPAHQRMMALRGADLCEQAAALVTIPAGPDPDLRRAVAEHQLNPPIDTSRDPVYRLVWVAQIPGPRNLFKAPGCMAPLSSAERWRRQLWPTREIRRCCRYHSIDWHQAARGARWLLRTARRGGGTTGQIHERALEVSAAADWPEWLREGAESLLCTAEGIIVGREAGYESLYLINGQHRTQALVEAGVRRTVVLWEPEG